MVGAIPDLRLDGTAWIDLDEDRALARELLESGLRAEQLVFDMFARRPDWTRERAAARTREVTSAPERLEADLDGWLSPAFRGSGPVLDLGCGPGGLLAAAASRGHAVIGIDVSLAWLVVARAALIERGAAPMLAAAFGEALPLPDGAVTGVVSLDVIEHVADRPRYVAEVHRVLAGAGTFLLSTPNRFSLGAEPHVGVWGVGWLPRRWQRGYAEWRSGRGYGSTWLLSWKELRRILTSGGRFSYRVTTPPLPQKSIVSFGVRRKALAGLYNWLLGFSCFRLVSLSIGPFFHVTAVKRS